MKSRLEDRCSVRWAPIKSCSSTSARLHAATLPIIPYKVTIVANQMNALSFIPHFHLQKSTGMVDISNISVERVVTDPEPPGFQMRIPPGAQIISCDACAVNESASFMAVCGDPALKCIPREASLAWGRYRQIQLFVRRG
jgi:hypothetical protein